MYNVNALHSEGETKRIRFPTWSYYHECILFSEVLNVILEIPL